MLYETFFLLVIFIISVIVLGSDSRGGNTALCVTPTIQCGTECVNIQDNGNYCGSCFIDCTTISQSDGTCTAGACNCEGENTFCNEPGGDGPRCVVLGTYENCSSCGDNCANLENGNNVVECVAGPLTEGSATYICFTEGAA